MTTSVRQLQLDPMTGKLTIQRLAVPQSNRTHQLVRTSHSVVSTGTELSKVHLAKQSPLDKAKSRPDQVQKVLQAVATDGIVATAQKVMERLSTPMGLGYSLAGTVLEAGGTAAGLPVGTRVACGGANAEHAEVVSVPTNLVVPIPDGVSMHDAAFATIGAVAMHGCRTAEIQLGDRVVIVGLGLLGQLAVRLAVAAGAHVYAVDLREDRVRLATRTGAESGATGSDSAVASAILAWSRDRGADSVIITAGGGDAGPLHLAAACARDRARVVVVGTPRLEVPREEFYRKELTLVVSRSYGPGRYDADFEEKGYTYPEGYVPWTERRNMEEFLDLLAARRIRLDDLGAETVPLEEAPAAYERLAAPDGSGQIALVLSYAGAEDALAPGQAEGEAVSVVPPPGVHAPRALSVSLIGAGNFAAAHLLPAIKAVAGVELAHVVATRGLRADTVRRRSKFRAASTDPGTVWSDEGTTVAIIATRHDTHARFTIDALSAGKAVFVEKPLALTEEELDRVSETARRTGGRFMVGFNRRFAPAVGWALERIGDDRADLRMHFRIAAGPLPADHWLLDPDVGGGRLLGEGCHFVDLACFAAASAPVRVRAEALDRPGRRGGTQDFLIALRFSNGATATIEYLSSSNARVAKEHLEFHRSGVTAIIRDYLDAEVYRGGRAIRKKWRSRDKGHRAEIAEFLAAVRAGKPTPIPESESVQSMLVTLLASRSIAEGRTIAIASA